MTDPTNIYQTVPARQVVRRPPLLARQRSGARLAGIIAFLMLSLGFGMLGIPLAILAVTAVVAVIFRVIGRASGSPDWYRQLLIYAERLQPEQWIIPLVVIAVVGTVIIVASLFVSWRILTSHGVQKAWPVTWAAAGIAVVGSWIASAVLSGPLQIVGIGGEDNSMRGVALRIIVGVIGFIVGIAATAAIGWLSWWWMAHVMRAPADISADDAASATKA